MKLFRMFRLLLITYFVVFSVSSDLYAKPVTIAVADSSSYSEKSIIRFAKRCGMEAERVKSTHIDINRYDGLIVTMMSHIHKTTIVEGIRHRSLPIIAVQWHPENSGKGTKIGKEFKKMCLAYRHINSR